MESIINAIKLWIDFLGTTLQSIGSLFSFVPEVMEGVWGTIAYAPDFIAPFLILSGVLTVLFGLIRLI